MDDHGQSRDDDEFGLFCSSYLSCIVACCHLLVRIVTPSLLGHNTANMTKYCKVLLFGKFSFCRWLGWVGGRGAMRAIGRYKMYFRYQGNAPYGIDVHFGHGSGLVVGWLVVAVDGAAFRPRLTWCEKFFMLCWKLNGKWKCYGKLNEIRKTG